MTGTHDIQDAHIDLAEFPREVASVLERAELGELFHWAGPLALCARSPRVCIIGTRTPGPKTKDAAELLAFNLARRGAVIVSGAALGTDWAAHCGALRAGGGTIACVPFGLETVDLATWRGGTLDPSAANVLAITALEKFQQVTMQTPVLRNRLTAALAEVVVIGEAGLKSGTHHCRSFAEKLGVPIFFLTEYGDADDSLTRAHREWSRRGARAFSLEEAGSEEIVAAIFESSEQFRAREKRADAAQFKLFGDG